MSRPPGGLKTFTYVITRSYKKKQSFPKMRGKQTVFGVNSMLQGKSDSQIFTYGK